MSKLEDIVASVKTAIVNTGQFNTVERSRIVGQAYQKAQLPAAGIWRPKNVASPKRPGTIEQTTYDVVFIVEIAGSDTSSKDASDQQLIVLRNAVNTALLNNTHGGKCSPMEPVGDEPSLDTATPFGYEQVAVKCSYTESKPAIH